MKPILALAVFALAASPFSVGQMTDDKSASKNAKVEQQLIDLEKQRNEAVVKGDTAALDKMTADDYEFTNPSGQVRTKAQILQDIKSGELKYESIDTDDVKARVYGNAAVLTGRATTKGQSGGKDVSGQYRFTRVYVKGKGGWRSVAFQQTRVAEPEK
jgi:ketosteroid isomerase-like protein